MKKIMIRSAAALLSALMLLSVSGCSKKTIFEAGGDESPSSENNRSDAEGGTPAGGDGVTDESTGGSDAASSGYSDNIYRNIQLYTNLEEYEAEKHLNAAEIFANMTYSPDMFCGKYVLEEAMDPEDRYIDGYGDTFKNYAAKAKYMDFEVESKFSSNGKDTVEIGTLPMEMTSGTRSNYDIKRLRKISKYHWITFDYPKRTKYSYEEEYTYRSTEITGAFYIEGHKLIFTPLTKLEYDDDYENVVDYALSDKSIEYEFKFEGGKITLTNSDGDSVTLVANGLSELYHYMSIDGYAASDANKIDDICGFDIYKGYLTSSADTMYIGSSVKLDNPDDEYYFNTYYNLVTHFNEDGIMQFSWAEQDGTPHAYEFVYFYCDSDGLILTDGEKVYKYTASYSDYKLGAGVETTDEETLGKLGQGQVAAIAEKKKNLMDELKAAFEKENIAVDVNDETGEIIMDSSVLFGVDQYEITDKGQEFLKKFIKAYSTVILKDDYEGFVSKIMVEGHTDSTGERSHNEELSQKRAEEVMNYCLSDKAGIDKTVKEDMKKLMEAVGYADDYPVFDEGGKEDMEKSRRVSFKFVIDMENASKLDAIEEKPQEEEEEPETTEEEPAA